MQAFNGGQGAFIEWTIFGGVFERLSVMWLENRFVLDVCIGFLGWVFVYCAEYTFL